MENNVYQSEVRFHAEDLHRRRALGELPFSVQESLVDLVREAYASGCSRTDIDRSANPYALLPDTLAFLRELLDRLDVGLVVEFGSGASTSVFAGWVAAHGRRLLSVEHDRGWVEEVRRRLPADERSAVDIIHAPLRLTRRGLRQFLTYRGLVALGPSLSRAGLVLIDGPHFSGREVVLHTALSNCSPGAVVVVDDFRHYAVRNMLLTTPSPIAACWAGQAVEENSHGLYVLRCLRKSPPAPLPSSGARSILQSYWRCLRDFRQYGTGD